MLHLLLFLKYSTLLLKPKVFNLFSQFCMCASLSCALLCFVVPHAKLGPNDCITKQCNKLSPSNNAAIYRLSLSLFLFPFLCLRFCLSLSLSTFNQSQLKWEAFVTSIVCQLETPKCSKAKLRIDTTAMGVKLEISYKARIDVAKTRSSSWKGDLLTNLPI